MMSSFVFSIFTRKLPVPKDILPLVAGKATQKARERIKATARMVERISRKATQREKERTRATAKVARREISTEDLLPLLLGKVVIRERMGSATTVVSLDTGPEIAGRRRPMRKPV